MPINDLKRSNDQAALLASVLKTLPPQLKPVLDFTQKIHATQKRFGADTELAHLYRVYLIIRHELDMDDPDLLAAALLHDSVEDQPVSLDDIERLTNSRVAVLVGEVTSPVEEIDAPEFLAKISHASDEGMLLKLADRLDNCRGLTALAASMPDFVKEYCAKTIEFFLPRAYHCIAYLASELESAVKEAEGEKDGIYRAP